MHVRAANREAKIWLHDLTPAVNAGFPAHELNDIVRHLALHRDELLVAWNEYFGN